MIILKLLNTVIALVTAPLLLGVINRTKAFFAGRNGPPLLQPYYDIWKLLHKGSVYSSSTSLIFRIGPVIGISVVLIVAAIVPFGGLPVFISFPGDLILFAYLFGLSRFFTVLMAMDTGSSFEGMGASREVTFSTLSEPALLIGLAVIAKYTGYISLSQMLSSINSGVWLNAGPAIVLVGFAILIVFLTENSRIPIDDPNTHLELTMIHEVMILDNSGPDLAMILYSAAMKMWLLGAILIGIVAPVHSGNLLLDVPTAMLFMFILAVLVGIIESSMARLRLLNVPQLLIGATSLSVLALILILR
jgi:formate hydrogenlyase subunit 4